MKKIEKLIEVLKSGARSYKFIQENYKLDEEQVNTILSTVSGYNIFKARNQYSEIVVTLVKDISLQPVVPKEFIYKVAKNTPYVQVNIPHKGRHKIKVIPMADLHYGANFCDKEKLERYIDWVLKEDDAYIILLGDLVECASRYSVGSGVYDQMKPQQQAIEIIKHLEPIKHKLLLYISGNHELRTYNQLGFDIGYFIAEKLGVPYFSEPTHLDITFADYTFTFFCWHGRSNAMTEGGKLNAALYPLSFTEFCHFYISGHVHDKSGKEKERISRDLATGELIRRKQYIIITGSFLEYFNTYASRSGYPPPSSGTMVAVLYENGDYRVTS